MVALPVQEWTPSFQTEATCHMTPRAHSLFHLAAQNLFRRDFCSSGKLLGQITTFVGICVLLCFHIRFRFVFIMSFYWIYFVMFSLVDY